MTHTRIDYQNRLYVRPAGSGSRLFRDPDLVMVRRHGRVYVTTRTVLREAQARNARHAATPPRPPGDQNSVDRALSPRLPTYEELHHMEDLDLFQEVGLLEQVANENPALRDQLENTQEGALIESRAYVTPNQSPYLPAAALMPPVANDLRPLESRVPEMEQLMRFPSAEMIDADLTRNPWQGNSSNTAAASNDAPAESDEAFARRLQDAEYARAAISQRGRAELFNNEILELDTNVR